MEMLYSYCRSTIKAANLLRASLCNVYDTFSFITLIFKCVSFDFERNVILATF